MDNFQDNSYLEQTFVWEFGVLEDSGIDPVRLQNVFNRLYDLTNRMISAINLKESGIYDELETLASQSYFPVVTNSNTLNQPLRRTVQRKVINFGSLPNTTTKSVAHGITFQDVAIGTRIIGSATKPGPGLSMIPIPFASPTLADNISVEIDDTNVNVTTGSDRTAYTICYIVIEYLPF